MRCAGVDAQRRPLGYGPFHRGDAVVERRRERMLGEQRIFDAQAAQAGPFGELARKAVIGVETAEHPSAAVDEHDRGRGSGCAGIVEPQFGAAARHVDRRFLDVRQRRAAGVKIERQAGVDAAKLRRQKLGRGR